MPIWFMVVLTVGAALLDALQRPRPQPSMRSAAMPRPRGSPASAASASVDAGLRHPRLLRRHRRGAVRDPAPGHPVDRAAQPRAHHHHRLGGRRRQHPGRHRHGDRLDPGRDPVRRDRLLADLPQRLALLAARRAGRADPGHRARRPVAPAPAARCTDGHREQPTAPSSRRAAARPGDRARRAPGAGAARPGSAPASSSSRSTTCSTRAG